MRVPLFTSIESRTASNTKDAKLFNCFVDTDGNNRRVVKRPGLSSFSVSPTLPVASAQGLYSFHAENEIYAILDNTVHEITTGGVVTNKGSVSSGLYSFTETSATPYLFFHNSNNGYTINGSTGTFAEVTDVDFPPKQTPAKVLVPGSVYLDDFIFVMTDHGKIYNSALEDPTTWGALDYIEKTSEPDDGVAIAKHFSYLVAWGHWSGEFFYNAGNPTGSPLSRNDTAKMEIGCASGDSVVEIRTAQTVVWIGQGKETGRGIYCFEGLAPKKISNSTIDRYLNGDPLTNVRAYSFSVDGHPFYILTLKDTGYTLIYDFHENLWYFWTSDDGLGVESYFKWEFYTSHNGESYLLHGTSGELVKVKTDIYKDLTANINYKIVTPRLDGNSNKNKFHFSLELIGDTFTSAGTISVKYSDDDYQTWSSYRTVDMTKKRPIIYQLGRFRRRSFDIWSTVNLPIRLEGMEVNIVEGTN